MRLRLTRAVVYTLRTGKPVRRLGLIYTTPTRAGFAYWNGLPVRGGTQ